MGHIYFTICFMMMSTIFKYYYALSCKMVRPRKTRLVQHSPDVTYFKPRAVPLSELQEVELGVDDLETIRLSDLEMLTQEAAARQMGVHQSTFQRALSRARSRIADALVNGKAIKIHGGDFRMRTDGRVGGGPGGACRCPKCGAEKPHIKGQPCMQTICDRCGSTMPRKEE